jgi:GNAT superfamily N-acetyltransferase
VNEATAAVTIEEWRPDLAAPAAIARDVDMLAGVLHAVVHGGAGVSFIVPFSLDDARAFWNGAVLPGVIGRRRRMLVARCDGRIVGTVQLDPAWAPNQPHRAEVLKLLVHPDARRRGIARALMVALEALARDNGWTLLTLDTWTGQAGEQLYRALGYTAVGSIPRFARGSTTPELEPATIMYKDLEPPRASGAQ